MRFYVPTRVLGGTDIVKKNAVAICTVGMRPLLVAGRHAARDCGALDDVSSALKSQGAVFELFDGVLPNPHLSTCREAAHAARRMNADCIIGVGGGSALDAAKVTAILTASDVDDDALFNGRWSGDVLPVIAIPTTAGTGSEVTPYAILTNPAIESKSNVSSEKLFPALALLDGRYLCGLPDAVMRSTLVDALSHAVEGYLSRRADSFSRSLALGAMRRIAAQLRIISSTEASLTLEPADLDDRLEAACLAGMVIAHTGTTAVHALGYSLTCFMGVPHGQANGWLLASCLRFIEQEYPDPVREALDAMELTDSASLESWMRDILGAAPQLSPQDCEKYVSIAMKAANRANTLRIPTSEDLRTMLAFACQKTD